MLMRRLLAIAVFLGAGISAARGDSLENKISALLANPQLKGASLGLEIQEITARGGVILYSNNAATPLGPASNCKILTTAAAFERYGPRASFKTQLFQVGPDLLLMGGGDPGFCDAKISKAGGQTPLTVFEEWAGALKQAGITRYRNLIVDDLIFDTQWVHPNWPANQLLDWYAAPVGGLNFNANCLDWTPKLTAQGVAVELMPATSYITVANKATRGTATKVSLIRPPNSNKFELRGTVAASASTPYSVPIHDPGLWTGTILRDLLNQSGITGEGDVRRALADERFGNGTLLASHETPLLSVIERANTNSLNMMAEGLCKRLGYDAGGGKQPGSWANGTAAVEAYVTGLGVRAEQISLDDGSGLSNKNKVAPHALATVLAHVAARADGKEFMATFAKPGEDGTLEKRFKGMSVASHVHAKTGHITGVSTLSGYILRDDRRFAFSILVNKYQGNVNPWQDQVCQAIYDWAGGK